jgi:outer membrane protein TolC
MAAVPAHAKAAPQATATTSVPATERPAEAAQAAEPLALTAATEPTGRPLSLRDAIELALRGDPGVAAAVATRERGDLAVLRAQLDRVSIRVDTFLTEQWRAANLGGSAPPASCSSLLPLSTLPDGSMVGTPVQLFSVSGSGYGSPTQSQCDAARGIYVQSDAIASGFQGQFNLAADLRLPLFTGFRITSNVDRARHQRDAAAATVRDNMRQVALTVLRAYWAVRRVELQQQVSQQAIARFQEAVQVVTARVRAGLAAQADINRMETRRQNELARRADLAGSASESRAQLAVALGLGGTPLSLTENTDTLPLPPSRPEELDELLSTAYRERPDLRAMQAQVLAAASMVRMARSTFFPQLSLSSLMQFSNNPFNPLIGARAANQSADPFANITGSLFVGGTLSMNLFDTMNSYTGLRDAQLEHRRTIEENRRIGRLIESDVRSLHARLSRLYSTREPQLRSREIARDNLDISERRYKNGDIGLLDFIDAQVELLNAEINLANTAASIAQTWSELYLASGRLPPAPGAEPVPVALAGRDGGDGGERGTGGGK